MRRKAGEMDGPLHLVYIAGTVADAENAERTLTEQGVDYVLSLESFASTSVMRMGEHKGLFVYVPAEQHESCRVMLERNGLTDTVAFDAGLPVEKTNGA